MSELTHSHTGPGEIRFRGRRTVRTWTAVAALVAVTSLSFVVLESGEPARVTPSAAPAAATADLPQGVRYDGGPEEGTRGVVLSEPAAPVAGTRYDGGPEEGTRGVAR